jgi:hypothetical protein
MAPEITVAVPSHERALRLRWLLNALEEQTLDGGRWELVVVHDSRGEETQRLLDDHPIRGRVVLRDERLPAGTGTPSRQRNVAWRLARTPLVAFVDDDCRPEPTWLEALLRRAGETPGAIVQGATRPDPFEEEVLAAPHSRSLRVDPPGVFGQTCNILYPRAVLERLGGFDETFSQPGGEDTDLLWRALADGVGLTGATGAVVNHAVESFTTLAMVRMAPKWGDLPAVVKRHPGLRSTFTLRVFWRPSHPWLILGLAGAALAPRRPATLILTLPYLRMALDRTQPRPRSRLRAAVELPGRIAVDLSELAVLTRGSVRHRSPFL